MRYSSTPKGAIVPSASRGRRWLPLRPTGRPGRFAAYRAPRDRQAAQVAPRLRDPGWWMALGANPRALSWATFRAGVAAAMLASGLRAGRAEELPLVADAAYRRGEFRCLGPGVIALRGAARPATPREADSQETAALNAVNRGRPDPRPRS
jgi:hypothetical protein